MHLPVAHQELIQKQGAKIINSRRKIMMKRSKKVVSAATVSAILAAQAVMSAAAAGGSINVDMSTKSPILRVNASDKDGSFS